MCQKSVANKIDEIHRKVIYTNQVISYQNNMKPFLRKIIVSFLYLTPVGYLLSLFNLISGEATPGVYVYLPSDELVRVFIKKNPTVNDRANWFLNGGFLIIQAAALIHRNLGGKWGGTYAWMAVVFGVVNSVSAIFPTFNWNGKVLGVSIIWTLLILSLILTVVYFDIAKLLLFGYK